MSAKDQLKKGATQTLRQAPVVCISATTLALVSAIWFRSSLAYLAMSFLAGCVGLVLLMCAWRLRSFIGLVACYSFIGGASVFIARFVPIPYAFYSLLQGSCVCVATMFLLLWIFRSRVAEFCRLGDAAPPIEPAPRRHPLKL